MITGRHLSPLFQACLGVPTAAIGLGLQQLQCSGYVLQTIRLMLFNDRHAKDVPLLGEHFSVLRYWPQSSLKLLKKISFLQKSDPLTEKLQNFATKGFTRTWTDAFLPTFVENGKAQATKQTRGIHHKKGWYFAPFSEAVWSDLSENVTGSLFPHSPSLCQILSKSVQFEEIHLKMTHYNISVKPVGLSLTITCNQ